MGGRVDQRTVFEQHKPVISSHIEDLRRPQHAPGVVAAKYREEIARLLANVGETAKHPSRQRNHISRVKGYPRVVPMFAQVEAPAAAVDDEDFGGVVTMLRVDAARRLTGAADVEAVRLNDVHMLIGILRDARANDCKILLSLRPLAFACR